ncbi:hypothetical protein DFR58_11581 [Anaerobacterium chartisolvens]|uniref:Uncharacterized protein n=1 Tax=Anaerobacterium chartisolvens TaxID=1297424 RepID=A0A369B1R4_9FIRM|nr:hypothetical protein [Anaerobacterium chartisolvens]RCX14357.1 hypothetical protein DFR58_11581 [Anaerobacterium chartisolvens]
MQSAYEVLVSTPMGELPGKVSLNIDGTALSGVLSLINNDNPFSGGTIEDGRVAFSGELKTPMGKMPYTVTGTFIDGRIEAVAKTKMGNLTIKSK